MKKKNIDDVYFQINYQIFQENIAPKKVFTFLMGTDQNIQSKARNHIRELNDRAKKGIHFELINYLRYKKD